MTKLQTALEKWTQQLQNPKRRLQYFLGSLALIYFVWAFLFLNPLRAAKTELVGQIQSLQSQLTETKQRVDTLSKAVKTESISNALAEKKQLETRIKRVDEALAKLRFIFISMGDWVKLKKEIISQQEDMDKNISLASISDQPIQPWTPPVIDKADAVKVVPEIIYQHELEMKFQADYFSTIQYVARLEKLPWKVYWDSLNYKVLTYPRAEVTLKFHIFTHEKSEA